MMKAVGLDELTTSLSPALIATMNAAELRETFPVEFQDLDPLQEAEPSSAALLRFPSGHAAVVFGKQTDTITVSLPNDERAPRIYRELLEEAPVQRRIQWLRDDLTAADGLEALAVADAPTRARRR
jgi:hypothetical protein